MTLDGFKPGNAAFRAEMDAYARLVESQYVLPDGLLSRMMQRESQYDPNAIGKKEDHGILQQRPIFVRDLAGRFKYPFDPFNPKQALIAAAKYLAFYYKVTGGAGWDLTIIAYNQGPEALKAFLKAKALFGKAELSREVQSYIKEVLPGSFRG